MHELGIASSVLEAVAKEAERRPNTRFLKVGLRIGELAAVDRDALSFGWEVLTKDTAWHGLALEIESVPRRQRCTVCGHEFEAPDFMTACPKCAELMTVTIAGDELDIAYLEVEES
ncbi:MAG TPA: hydrogenase maturation nickel metallochaperone HypA [Terriglobales bacterium]|nr:hydrogenase maturation nickel metallochaperone HypA [Terriglobales bacterium]